MKMKNRLSVALAAIVAIAIGLFTQGDVGAASLQSTVGLNISAQLSAAGLMPASSSLSIIRNATLTSGVAGGQADTVYATTQVITTGATLSLDVKGSLLDAFGAAFTPAKLKVVYIFSSASNTTNLTLFGDAASVPILNTAATTSTLLPGGTFLMIQPPLAGIAVTAATADIIKIVNAAGASATVDVVLIGTST